MSASSLSGRLSKDIHPVAYQIDLRILPEERVFSGKVSITLRFRVPSRHLSLHALDLKIEDASLLFSETEPGTAENRPMHLEPANHPASETIQFIFPREIPAGEYRVSMRFSGKLNRGMRGLYEAHARGEIYAFTQFEATDARRMFPCFDEPEMKARFRLRITAPADLVVLSNMPMIKESIANELKTIDFDETPPMSTYLLALAVARLEKKEMDVEGISVAVWTLPEQVALGDFALKVSAAVIPLLNNYFDLQCPTKKLDLVSVPDFAMGAMENWGLIFFRDIWLLLDEDHASVEMQRGVASIITHEIVHQWFGNLVTMVWWDDLWLNESFATWLACKIIDQWRPEWQVWQAFQVDKALPLALDALENTRPIQAGVSSPAEIEEMFDVLTYEKGGACLRMIEQFLGDTTFRSGIRHYIKTYQYNNATAENLWTELSAVSKQPVSEIAKDWFTRAGFPMLKIDSDGSSDFSQIQITQQRFSAFADNDRPASLPWTIPCAIRYEDDAGIHTHRSLLTHRQTQLRLPASGAVQWIYGNAGESGFYRTNYDSPLRKALEMRMARALKPIEQIGALEDLWSLCQKGEQSIGSFLETLRRLSGDENRFIVSAICNYLEILFRQIVPKPDRTRFASFVEACLWPIWKNVSWDAAADDDDDRRLLRSDLLWTLGAVAQNEDILSELPRRQSLYRARPAKLDPTLATSFLRLCARSDGGTRFEYYIERFRKAKTPEERDRYLKALADFGKPFLARKVLDFSLSDDVRPQDVWKPLRSLLANPSVQSETWGYLKAHWQAFREKGGSIGAQRMIQSTRHLWQSKWHDDVAAFFNQAENRVPSAERSLAQTLEFIQLGLQFKQKQTETLSSWLSERY